MKPLNPVNILLYYDYPQVFIAKDAVDCNMACMVVSEGEEGPKYLSTPISTKRKEELIDGRVDLKTVFENPELNTFMYVYIDGERFIQGNESLTKCPLEYLPEAGLTFSNDEVANQALTHNAPVSFVGLSVSEAVDEAKIKLNKLSEFLSLYQNALKHLARLSAKENSIKIDKNTAPFDVDVFGFSHGSFTVHVKSSYHSDLFGDNALLSEAYSRLNQFIELAKNPTDAIAMLQDVKGHTANSIIKLVEFVEIHSCPITHTWASPNMLRSECSKLDVEIAKQLGELCRQRNDLLDEDIVLEGSIVRASEEANTWKLVNRKDSKKYSGEVDPDSNLSMSGVIIGEEVYRFYCHERVEVILGTGQERTKLSAYKIEKIV